MILGWNFFLGHVLLIQKPTIYNSYMNAVKYHVHMILD